MVEDEEEEKEERTDRKESVKKWWLAETTVFVSLSWEDYDLLWILDYFNFQGIFFLWSVPFWELHYSCSYYYVRGSAVDLDCDFDMTIIMIQLVALVKSTNYFCLEALPFRPTFFWNTSCWLLSKSRKMRDLQPWKKTSLWASDGTTAFRLW